MPALALAQQNSLLDLVLRKTAYTPPAALYVALFTSPVTATTLGTEVTGGSYARASVAFAAAANGLSANTNEISIVGMPAVTIASMAIMSAVSGGVHVFYGSLTPARTTNAGDTFTVRAGDLTLGFQ